jgi:hypothetical protein
MAGCKKQLDINRNPNQPTEESITAELILPNALHGVGVQTANGYGFLSNWMGYWSASGSFNPSTEESSYGITNTFGEGKWAGTYNVLFDLHKVQEKALTNNQPFYRSVALITTAHLFQNLVDVMVMCLIHRLSNQLNFLHLFMIKQKIFMLIYIRS